LNLSRNQIQKLIRDKKIEIVGKRIKPAFILLGGEVINIKIPENEPLRMIPENIPLDIRYEDENIIVVNKPPDMVVHPARGHFSGTLVHALLAHCNKLSEIGGETRPGVIHRLDKDTSGLIIFAKNDISHRRLAYDLAEKKIQREYSGIIWGNMTEYSGFMTGSIGHNPKDHKKMAVVNNGKTAITEYRIIDNYRLVSFVEFKLYTGRTHQIRVHCSDSGHPIFGDFDYGGREERISGYAPEYKQIAMKMLACINRQALHARKLSFYHPTTKEYITIESEIPNDIINVLDVIKAL